MAKDPAERWQSADDLLIQLQWIQKHDLRAPAARERRWWRAGLGWAVAAAAIAVAAIGWGRSPSPVDPPRPIARLDLTMPPNLSLPDYAAPVISPDATRIVISASGDAKAQLFVRRLDDPAFVPLAGTEGARGPFWSPDSQSIAFFAGGKLKRIDAGGGPITVVCDGSAGVGGAWNRQGTIVFAPGVGSRLFQVPASGGTPAPATELDAARRDNGHRFPYFLPDGRTFLFAVGGGQAPGIYAGSLDHQRVKRVINDGSYSAYVEPGFLLFVRQQTLMAVPFDADAVEPAGAPQPVADRVRGGLFSVASNGTIVYRSGADATVKLSWFARDGRHLGAIGAPGPYRQIALSPSGRRVAIQQGNPGFFVEPDGDLWLIDLATGVHSRLTSDPAFDADPAWSPDERSLAFTSTRSGRSALFVKNLVTGAETQLLDFPERVGVDEWTPDGRYVIFRNFGRAVFALPTSGDRTPKMLADTPYLEDQPHVSPDGRWIAFDADESGRWEVYLARFPDFSARRQVSTGGGMQPLWRRDSRELYYISPQGYVTAVAVGASATAEPAAPRPLFQVNLYPSAEIGEYGVTGDGQRFLVGEPTSRSAHSMTFLFNWRPAAR